VSEAKKSQWAPLERQHKCANSIGTLTCHCERGLDDSARDRMVGRGFNENPEAGTAR
jgi:hypothetical protein